MKRKQDRKDVTICRTTTSGVSVEDTVVLILANTMCHRNGLVKRFVSSDKNPFSCELRIIMVNIKAATS